MLEESEGLRRFRQEESEGFGVEVVVGGLRYRLRAHEVEAVRWAPGVEVEGVVSFEGHFAFKDRSGLVHAGVEGDWIIEHPDGLWRQVVQGAVFEHMYERVEG